MVHIAAVFYNGSNIYCNNHRGSFMAQPTRNTQNTTPAPEKTFQELIFERAFQATGDLVYIYDLVDGRSVYTSGELGLVLGYSAQEILDMGDQVTVKLEHPDDYPKVIEALQKVQSAADNEVVEVEHRVRHVSGEWRWMNDRMTVFAREDDGRAKAMMGIMQDISARKAFEVERESLQQQLIDAQKQALLELSTPIIPIIDQIIIMPLIGSIDTARAQEITRALLRGISQHNAHIVIMDITGVAVVDSGIADHLNRTIQAARLKGAHTIITGISDAVAETIVDLGIDWGGLETLRDLQSGLIAAFRRLGYSLERSKR
jgi:PAS domain S-box-containing protein